MTSRIDSLSVDANDPLRLARFWAAALRWEIEDESDDDAFDGIAADPFGCRRGDE